MQAAVFIYEAIKNKWKYEKMFSLETKDLILRDITPSDIETHLFWFSKETEWWEWDAACWYLQKLSAEQLQAEIENKKNGLQNFVNIISKKKPEEKRYSFEIEEKSSGRLVGWISCYCIDSNFETTDDDAFFAFGIDIPEKKYRNKGYGFQAFSAAINYYKANGINEVYTQTWSGNIPMIKLAEKIGFKLVNVRKNIREHNGQKYDALTFKI